MSGIPCDTARVEEAKGQINQEMDSSIYMDPMQDDENIEMIGNKDNGKAQEPVMHEEIPTHDEGEKTKENNMNVKDKKGAPEEMKEPTKDKLIQNKKQEEKLKDDEKIEKTQKTKGKPKNSVKKGSCNKKGDDDNPWVAYPCSICNTGVGFNSCQCNECKKWCHLKCSGLSSLDKYNENYKCSRCMMKKKRGPGRPRLLTLTLEQESARAVRKFQKSKKRPKDNESPDKSNIKSKKNKEPDSSPNNKKPKAGDEGGDDEDDEEDTEEDDEGEDDDAENEDKDVEALEDKTEIDEEEIMWLGQKIGNKDKISKYQNKEFKKVLVYEGGHLTEEDVISLNYGNHVTDAILLFFITILRRMRMDSMVRNKIKIVDPSVAHLMKNSTCLNTITKQKNEERLKEYDWVMYPVNNDAPDGNGGTHWSLLVYRKSDNKLLHFDPIKGLNKKHAVELMLKIQDEEMIDSDGYGPQFVEIPCEKQKNGSDCGPFVMIFMQTILENIVKGREADDDKFVIYQVDEMRETLRNIINDEMKMKNMGKTETKKEEKGKDGEKTSIQKEKEKKGKSRDKRNDSDEGRRYDEAIDIILDKISNKLDNSNIRMKMDDRSIERKRDDISNKNSYNHNEPNIRGNKREHNIPNADTRNVKIGGQQRKPCYNHFNTMCYYGSDCRFDHPRICESWIEMGSCPGVNGSCEKPHPMLCRSFGDQVECRRGRYCKFLHPRLQKSRRHKAQSTDSGGSHGRNL